MYFFYRNETKSFSMCCSCRKSCITPLLSGGTTLFCSEDWSVKPFLPVVGTILSEIQQRLICGNFCYSLTAFKYIWFVVFLNSGRLHEISGAEIPCVNNCWAQNLFNDITLWRQEEECEIKQHRSSISSKHRPLPLIIIMIKKMITIIKY
jgi:hypothetical protein